MQHGINKRAKQINLISTRPKLCWTRPYTLSIVKTYVIRKSLYV